LIFRRSGVSTEGIAPIDVKFISDPITLASGAVALITGAMIIYTQLASRSGSRALSTLEATQMMNSRNAVVLDVRSADEFASGSITNAKNFPLETLKARGTELARFKNRPVIVVCAAGQRSSSAVKQLSADGFTEVFNLGGGVGAWRAAGLPLIKPVSKDKA
jgi:rhodanese-related sulfurtransferase